MSYKILLISIERIWSIFIVWSVSYSIFISLVPSYTKDTPYPQVKLSDVESGVHLRTVELVYKVSRLL